MMSSMAHPIFADFAGKILNIHFKTLEQLREVTKLLEKVIYGLACIDPFPVSNKFSAVL